jgi:hypothetical protein
VEKKSVFFSPKTKTFFLQNFLLLQKKLASDPIKKFCVAFSGPQFPLQKVEKKFWIQKFGLIFMA